MSVYVEKYVSGCDKCQQTKNRNQPSHGLLQPNSVPTGPWQIISCDLITQLPESLGYTAIFVVVDQFTKMIRIAPTFNEITAIGVARLLRDILWSEHGTPEVVISDRGTQFAAEVMRELNKMLRIKTTLSTAYHPQTDGQTE